MNDKDIIIIIIFKIINYTLLNFLNLKKIIKLKKVKNNKIIKLNN